MCTVSSPKPQPVDTSKTTPVYMHNAYLDGLGINAANTGRNNLRIDLGSAPATPGSPSGGSSGGTGVPYMGATGTANLGIGASANDMANGWKHGLGMRLA